jgi:hypothetical protein
MKKTKSSKIPRFAHTNKSPKGMGDHYGTGIKQKLGKVIEGMGMKEITPKKLKTPPKNLA